MRRRRFALPLPILFALSTAAAQQDAPRPQLDWVPRPSATAGNWVSDPSEHLASETRWRVNQEITALRRGTGAEIAVVLVDSTGGMHPNDFATALRDRWDVGQRGGAGLGILVLIVPPRRQLRVVVTRGLQRSLDGAKLARIEDEAMLAEFRRRDMNAGVLRGVRELAAAVRQAVGSSAVMAAKGSPGASATTARTAPATEPRSTSAAPAPKSGAAAQIASAFGAPPAAVTYTPPAAPAAKRATAPAKRAAATASAAPPVVPAFKSVSLASADSARRDSAPATAAALPAAGFDAAARRWLSGDALTRGVVPGALAVFAAGVGGLAFLGVRRRRAAAGRAVCPTCARRALVSENRLVRDPAPGVTGLEVVVQRCDHCGWNRQFERPLAALRMLPPAPAAGPRASSPGEPRRSSSGTRTGAGR